MNLLRPPPRPRLAESGFIDPDLARHLIATTNPTMRAVLALGPWRPVSVGRAMRTLPPWLRAVSELLHRHCRGPGCGLPASSCQGDHLQPWSADGVSALFNDVRLCGAHNRLKHEDEWSVERDLDTGEVTWTSADGSRVVKLPPPDL